MGAGYQMKITVSYATGAVNGTGNDVSSLVGVGVRSAITAFYATGAVIATQADNFDAGGLVGFGFMITIIASYARGKVTGTGDSVGGLVGNLVSIREPLLPIGTVTPLERERTGWVFP